MFDPGNRLDFYFVQINDLAFNILRGKPAIYFGAVCETFLLDI
jgi:hypothetical protein